MLDYIAVVKNEDNKVTKYQDFAAKSDADVHIAMHGGFVVDKPSSDRMDYWVVDDDKETVTYDKSTADSDDAAIAAVAYKAVRRAAYPEIGDQLDALWKGGDAQAAMKVIVDKVKSDNPKP
jgi:hypothetical protein